MSDSARQWLARADRAHRREDMEDFIERAAAGALVEIAETLERAMSEQRGLRNPDTHGTTSDGEPYCESCGVCDEGWRCRCCLAAEVEALRAQVARVREAVAYAERNYDAPIVTIGAIKIALDGGDA